MDHHWSSSRVLLVSQFLLWFAKAPSATCPPSSFDFEGRCYHFSSQTFNARQSAVSYCQTFNNGKLDAPQKPMENDFFRERLDSITDHMPGAWIEPTDEETENVWKCGRDPCKYENWRPPSEPNGGPNNNCAVMFINDGLWEDNQCNDPDDTFHAVCKIDEQLSAFLVPSCPENSAPIGSRCYLTTEETFATKALAIQHCNTLDDGRMETPQKLSENDFVKNSVSEIEGHADGVWLEINDIENEGNWKCHYGDSPCNFLHWFLSAGPDGGVNKNCAIMLLVDGRWRDISCEGDTAGRSYHAICSFNLPTFGCREGSIQYNNRCYLFTLETFLTERAAKDYCRGIDNGRLFQPKGPIENDLVLENVRGIEGHEPAVWLDADDRKNEGTWECGKGPCPYLNWDPAMVHQQGANLDCAILLVSDGYWTHHSCDHDDELYHAACESDLVAVVIETDEDSTTKHEEMTTLLTTTVLTTTNTPTTLRTTTIEPTTQLKTTAVFTTHHTTTQPTTESKTTEQTTIHIPTTHVTTTGAQTTELSISSKPITTVFTTDFTTKIPTTEETTSVQTTTEKLTTLVTTTGKQTTGLETSSKSKSTAVTTEFATTIPTTEATTTVQTTTEEPTTLVTTTGKQTTGLEISSKSKSTFVTTEFTTTIPTTCTSTTDKTTAITTTSELMTTLFSEGTTKEIQTTRPGTSRIKELNCSHVLDVEVSESKYHSHLFQRRESLNSPMMVLQNNGILSSLMCAVGCLKNVHCSAILFHNNDGVSTAVCELLRESFDGATSVTLYDGVSFYIKLTCFQ